MEKQFEKTILKLNKIFSLGYVPNRGNQSYNHRATYTDQTYGELGNCFSHACFNLTNELYEEYEISDEDILFFQGGFRRFSTDSNEEVAEKVLGKIKTVGLIVSPATDIEVLKENQWRVAMYFNRISFPSGDYIRDYHFLLQEKDSSWSGKLFWGHQVENFETAPEIYANRYKYFDTFIITNPNAREK